MILSLKNTDANVDNLSLGELFDIAVRNFSAAPAVISDHDQLTYQELQQNANILANYLIDQGLQQNSTVAVCLERSPRVFWVVLGILKAGAAYVPLDPQYPRERLSYMLDNSGAKFLISESSLLDDLPTETVETLVLDQVEEKLLKGKPAEHQPKISPQDLAYIVYTSGSTGKPKGVAMTHAALVNLALWHVRDPLLGQPAKIVQFTPLSFDVHFQELFGTWLTGGTIVVIQEQLRLNTLNLLEFLHDERIERLYLPFVALQNLAEVAVRSADEGLIPSSLKDIITAGEQLQITRHIVDFFSQIPDCKLHNHYGPAETHVVTSYTLEGSPDKWPALPPIGKPVSNCTIHLLDNQMHPVAAGEVGEIFIGGPCVAQGYFGRKDLTEERFLQDHITDNGGRLYRSGDLGRQLSDGNYEYLGRIDGQIKIRGYRVEPGEVELAMSSHSAIAQAVVSLYDAGEGLKNLVTHFSTEAGAEVPSVNALRRYLKKRLPDYMIPSFFVRMETFPRTPSGKVDRRALPQPEKKRPDLEQQFVAPKTPTQELLASLWCRLLQFDRVGILDNFFDLGATSILCIQLTTLLKQEYGIELPVAIVFQKPTIQALAQLIDTPSLSKPTRIKYRLRRLNEENNKIAVIGMAGRFPGANTIEQLWKNLCNGVESTSFFTDSELDVDIDPVLLNTPHFVKARGILNNAEKFDAAFFRISPLEAQVMDPQQRIFLEITHEVFERAGYIPKEFGGRIGVFAGSHNNSYYLSRVQKRPDLIERLGQFQTMVANEKDYIATRIAHKMNLRGPAISIQTACSTSLVAVVSAVNSLCNHDCDMALAGAVSLTVPQRTGYLYEEGAMLSADGHCRPFDSNGTGTVFSDGAGVVLLKRLEDAERDGDEILAVLLGAAYNNDGAEKMSFSAPSIDGQADVIAQALTKAGVTADSLSYIETHGTATPLGDPIEVAALTQVFRSDTERHSFCPIGSIKSNFGHLTAAAGVAGLIKTVLSLKNGEIPPTLHFQKANPEIDFENSPFYVNNKLKPWLSTETPRRAGVSSFGVGGTNAHVIVEEAPSRNPDIHEAVRPYELLLFSAKSTSALAELASIFQDNVVGLPASSFSDVAYTLQCGREHYQQRRFFVCRNAEELKQLNASPNPASSAGAKVPTSEYVQTFMFPGQGAQYVGMGHSIYKHEPVFAETINHCADVLREYVGEDLRQLIFAEDRTADVAEQRLQQTRFTQPALFMVEYALATQFMHWGIIPQAMIGHSIGEYVCACVAGVFSLEDALKLVAKRGNMIQQMPAGSMLSVSLPVTELEHHIDGNISIACINEPSISVLSGPSDIIETTRIQLEKEGVGCRPLHTSHAFHSSMMEPAVTTFLETVKKISLSSPKIPFVSTVTGQWISNREALDPVYWASHMRRPVLFAPGISTLCAELPQLLLEVGPRTTLTTLARRQLKKSNHQFIASLANKPGDEEWRALLSALGKLWINGVSPDWDAFSSEKKGRRIVLPTYPFQRKRCWIEAVETKMDESNLLKETQPAVATENSDRKIKEQHMESNSNGRKARLIPEIQQILEEVSGLDIAGSEATLEFFDFGLDSLALTQAALLLKKRYLVDISFRQLMEELTTCLKLAEYLDNNLPQETPIETAASSTMETAEAAMPAAELPSQPLAVVNTGEVNNVGTRPPSASSNVLESIIAQQMEIMAQQLKVLSGQASVSTTQEQVECTSKPQPESTSDQSQEEKDAAAALLKDRDYSVSYGSTAPRRPFGAQAQIRTRDQQQLTDSQRLKFEELTNRYTKQTATSKQQTQASRKNLADPRTVSGFSPLFKEVTYPIVVQRSAGSRIWDVDGNEYIDLISGFGSNLFGSSAPVVVDSIKRQLEEGYLIGPQHPFAGKVARLVCELTGMDRVTFCNTGSEAVLGTTRAARTVTGKEGIVVFDGAYHGILDEVIVRNSKDFRGVPAAAGVAPSAVRNMHVLPYGKQESLDLICSRAGQLAAVLVESVQSRRPDFQPREFLHDLRRLTREKDIALIFDECITGFRLHPQGAQGMYGVKADLASYGKVIGGGLPFGVVAGESRFLDAFDGGFWNYGDNSIPEVGVTYYAGTFTRHPLALSAAKAVLEQLKAEGPDLQEKLNRTADDFALQLNDLFQSVGLPMHMANCGSMMNLTFTQDQPFGGLLYVLLRLKGVHIWEARPTFLNLAHSQEDLEFILQAFKEAIDELQTTDLLSRVS